MKKKNSHLLFLLLLLCPLYVLAQTNSINTSGNTDTLPVQKSDHSLYAGLGMGSNMIYLGSTISQDQPFGYGSVTYGFKDALYLSLTSVHLYNRNPFAAFSAGSISYNKVVNSWFDLSGSASAYAVAESLSDSLFNNFIYSELTVGFDWKILYTRLSAGVLISGGLEGYYNINNSRYFEIPIRGGDKYSISVNPYASILMGNITTSETSGKKIINGNPFKNPNSRTVTTTSYTTSFGMVELDIGIPVSFNAPKFTIEAEPGYVLPLYNDTTNPGTKGFLFLLSGLFRIL